jgi:hypothetical protein
MASVAASVGEHSLPAWHCPPRQQTGVGSIEGHPQSATAAGVFFTSARYGAVPLTLMAPTFTWHPNTHAMHGSPTLTAMQSESLVQLWS